ncbi:MAG: septation protein SepH [Kineosporiaceae bacterium]
MQDLTLVGVHDDGEHLVLAAGDGTRLRLPIDEALRAAVRRDRARLGQLQIAMDGRLSPREIQARIRGGQTAEAIAESCGLALEQVRRFEGPVLAEREHVADQARMVPLRRSAPAAAHPPTLDAVVTERLEQREVDTASARWDAWRQEDGAWTVQVAFTAAGRDRVAHWTYHPQLRQLTPADDEARWLVDADPEEAAARRLTAVRGPVYDVVAQGTLRPVPAEAEPDSDVPQPQAPSDGHATSATVDLLDTLRERRGRRMRALAEGEEDDVPDALQTALDPLRAEEEHADAENDAPATPPTPRPRPVPAPPAPGHSGRGQRRGTQARRSVPEPIRGTHPAGRRMPPAEGVERVVVLPDTQEASRSAGEEPARTPVDSAPERTAPADRRAEESRRGTPPAPAAAPAPAPDPADPAAARKGRRAVPSWDDIIFGARRE